MYYVSQAFTRAKKNYSEVKKVAFVVVIIARKLRLYFQAHVITVHMDQPLKYDLQQLTTFGRLIKWSVELGEFDIEYKLRGAIKSQVVTDFIAELTPSLDMELRRKPTLTDGNNWELHVDGSATNHASGDKIIIIAPRGEEMEYAIRFGFKVTNNEAKYEALVNRFKIAHKLGAKSIRVRSDSKLILNQVLGKYEVREDRMVEYLWIV